MSAGSLSAARTATTNPLGNNAITLSGGTLLLVSDELRRDAAALLRFMVAHQVQRIFVPFVYLQHLAEACADTLAIGGEHHSAASFSSLPSNPAPMPWLYAVAGFTCSV